MDLQPSRRSHLLNVFGQTVVKDNDLFAEIFIVS